MNYLYKYSPGNNPQENSAFVTELINGDSVYLLPNEDVTAVLVGKWDNDGVLNFIDDAVWLELRKFGNEAGIATSHLDLIHYQGHSQRQMQAAPFEETLPEYPIDNQPFVLRITRTKTTDDAWSHIPWGWTVDVVSSDPVRSITARAIGIYNEAGDYQYTTGSFVDDGSGDFGASCPVGQRTSDPEPIYFKLLFGASPEGAWSLIDLEEGAMQERLFWHGDQ